MEVICEHCKATLNIPDEKIPKGQKITATCPKCKHRLTIDTRKETGEGGSLTVASDRDSHGTERTGSGFIETEDEALEYFEEGVKLALVLGDDNEGSRKIESCLEALSFKRVVADNTRSALGKMRLHQFDLVIFPENFGGVALEQSPVLHFLNHLSMSLRRRMFVVVVGKTFKTMDQMMAFALSVNLVINENDLDQLTVILKRALSENMRFYKVFMETLQEVGRG